MKNYEWWDYLTELPDRELTYNLQRNSGLRKRLISLLYHRKVHRNLRAEIMEAWKSANSEFNVMMTEYNRRKAHREKLKQDYFNHLACGSKI